MSRKDATFNGTLGAGVPFETKFASDDESGAFEGYASVFGAEDQGFDTVVKGAFAGAIKARGASGIKMLWQHDPYEPLGVWDEVAEDSKGLHVKGRILLETKRGRETHALMKAGVLDGLSIGYRVIKADEGEGFARILKEVDVREISVVTFPMLEVATIDQVKAAMAPRTKRELEARLQRDVGFSSREAKALIAEGFKGLSTERDAGEDQGGIATALAEFTALLRQ